MIRIRIWLRKFVRILRCVFYILGKIPFVLFIILFGWFGFAVNDQGLDMMASFALSDNYWYLFWTIVYLFFWASAIWNVSRILLHTANLKKIVEEEVPKESILKKGSTLPENFIIARIDTRYKKSIQWLGKWVPRILALAPYSIFIWGYVKENWAYVKEDFFSRSWPVIIVALIAIVHFIILVQRRRLLSRLRHEPNPKWKTEIVQLDEEKSILKAIKYQRLRTNTLLNLIVCLGVFIYAFYVARSVPGLNGKPGLIILSSLIVYTFVGLMINLASNKIRLPLFLILVIFAFVFSLPRNNNHAIETLTGPEDLAMLKSRVPDTAYFTRWLNDRIAKKVFDTSKNHVIYLIASEGGGIRACYWTFQVLRYLHLKHPDIYNNTFAVTGASGGSVGLSFFYNYLHHKKEASANQFDLRDPRNYAALDTISSSDYLSAVSYGFVYPDLLQRFLPFRIKSFDRAKFLGNSFDKAFEYHLRLKPGESFLNKNFLETWKGRDAINYPAILFNSTYVELGTKAIISPFKITPTYYSDVLDVLSKTNRSIPMKEGMVSTARFPIITPPGLMHYDKDSNNKNVPFGHLVDGGYFENTAIQTAQQTALMMKSVLNRKGSPYSRIKPVIISIRYGTQLKNSNEPLGKEYEMAPIIGGYNILFRWIFGAKDLSIQLDSVMRVVEFGLRVRQDTASKHMLPLGWYLSSKSREIIRNEVLDSIQSREFKASYNQLKVYLK